MQSAQIVNRKLTQKLQFILHVPRFRLGLNSWFGVFSYESTTSSNLEATVGGGIRFLRNQQRGGSSIHDLNEAYIQIVRFLAISAGFIGTFAYSPITNLRCRQHIALFDWIPAGIHFPPAKTTKIQTKSFYCLSNFQITTRPQIPPYLFNLQTNK